MVVYLSFAAAALTDASLTSSGALARGEELRAYIAAQLSAAAPDDLQPVAATREATTLVALILGLSLIALLPGGQQDDLLDPVRRHLAALGLPPEAGTEATMDPSAADHP